MAMNSSQAGTTRRVLIAVAAVLLAGVLVATVAVMAPPPPRTVVMATGAQGGVYAETARRYQAVLARDGVKLELRTTRGGAENLELLRDPKSGVSVALAQGGLTSAANSPGIASLGTLFYEPVWIFRRGASSPRTDPLGFAGRAYIGEPGSGTRALVEELITSIGADMSRVEVVDMPPTEAGEALLRGELSLLAMVSGWEAPIVHRLLTAPGIEIVAPPRADAQVALRPYLTKLTLPRGVADLVSDRPPADVQLMATKASLLVRKDLHPAIQYLLLDAAAETHGAPGIFHGAGRFPAAEPMDVPLSEAARQYHRSGVPWLQRNLPFWLASLATQALVLLVPIVGVIYPIFRLLPAIYGWIMRRRIFYLYGELKFLEARLEAQDVDKARPELFAQLDQLEERAHHMYVPKTFAHMLYTLRMHIEIVRKRIANAGA